MYDNFSRFYWQLVSFRSLFCKFRLLKLGQENQHNLWVVELLDRSINYFIYLFVCLFIYLLFVYLFFYSFIHLFKLTGLYCCSIFFFPFPQSRDVFLKALSSLHCDTTIPGQEVSLRLLANDFGKETPVDDLPRPSDTQFTIITRPAKWQIDNLPFSMDDYFAELKTREIGRTLLHTPVITSTQLPFTTNMSFCQTLSSEMGVAWVAAQQTRGKGEYFIR